MTQEFVVENIKCGGCVNSLKNALLKIEQVNEVEVRIEEGLVKVNGTAPREILVSTLSELGYPESGSNSVLHKAKSYVSCAVGKFSE